MTNHNYPSHDHLEIDIESDIIDFPRRDFQKCQHIQVAIDSKALELVCKKCEAKVNPVLWIKDNIEYFARLQNRMNEAREKIKEDSEELEKRARTRWQHCRKMTAINLKHHKFVVLQ